MGGGGGFLVFNSRKGLSGKFGPKFTVQPETCLCITVVSHILRMWRLMKIEIWYYSQRMLLCCAKCDLQVARVECQWWMHNFGVWFTWRLLELSTDRAPACNLWKVKSDKLSLKCTVYNANTGWRPKHLYCSLIGLITFLPPANEVCEGYVFTGFCLSTGGLSVSVPGEGVSVQGGLCLEGVSVRETPQDKDPPYRKERTVCILLECIRAHQGRKRIIL